MSAQSYVHTPAHMVTRTLGTLPPPLQIFVAPPWIPCNLYDVRKIPQTKIRKGLRDSADKRIEAAERRGTGGTARNGGTARHGRHGRSGGRGALGIGWRPDAVR